MTLCASKTKTEFMIKIKSKTAAERIKNFSFLLLEKRAEGINISEDKKNRFSSSDVLFFPHFVSECIILGLQARCSKWKVYITL